MLLREWLKECLHLQVIPSIVGIQLFNIARRVLEGTFFLASLRGLDKVLLL
jgi:hypothetical protein